MNCFSETKKNVAVAVPWSFIDTKLKFKLSQIKDYELNAISINYDNFPVEIKKARFHIGQMNWLGAEYNGDSVNWSLELRGLNFEIPTFSVDRVIEQNIGGVLARIRLTANCSSIVLKQAQMSSQLNFKYSVHGLSIEALLNAFKLSWAAPWQFEPISCVGPQGFADLIQEELNKKLNDSQYLQDFLKPYLQEALQDRVSQVLQKLTVLTEFFPAHKSTYYFKAIEVMPYKSLGLLIYAQIFKDKDPSFELPDLSLSEAELDMLKDRPLLFVEKNSIKKVFEDEFKKYIFRGDLAQMKSFSSLLKSRFLQFFIWPDLLKYSKASKFPYLARAQDLQIFDFDSQEGLKIEANFEAWLNSERSQKSWNYLYSKTSFKGQFELEILNGNLVAKNYGSEDLKLKTKAQMYPEYIKTFNPKTSVATSILDKAIKASILSNGLLWQVPQIIFGSESYSAQQLKSSSPHNFVIGF